MAENQEDRSREDLTEEASPYRIEEFRQKGMVAQSRELSGLITLLATTTTLYFFWPQMMNQMMEYMKEVFKSDAQVESLHLRTVLSKCFEVFIGIGLPICIAGFIMGIIGSFIQIGGVFSFDPITPDLDKIDPIKGFWRLVSSRQVLDGIKTILKVTALVWASYLVIKLEIFSTPLLLLSEPSAMLNSLSGASKSILIALMGVLLVFAGIDFGFQRWEFSKNLRMTKQEAKQEFKEREGDPQIKARVKSVQREMARRRMMQAVKKADVVITNPTHIAVAIVYDREKMSAPKVVAKGADFLAQKIKKVASDAGIPLVENVPLARTLYQVVKVGQSVPRALYQAVAEVLAYVYRLKSKRL